MPQPTLTGLRRLASDCRADHEKAPVDPDTLDALLDALEAETATRIRAHIQAGIDARLNTAHLDTGALHDLTLARSLAHSAHRRTDSPMNEGTRGRFLLIDELIAGALTTLTPHSKEPQA